MKEVNFCINFTLHPGDFTWKFNPFHPKPISSLQEGCPYKHGPYKWALVYKTKTHEAFTSERMISGVVCKITIYQPHSADILQISSASRITL